jgi:hypothetical protein
MKRNHAADGPRLIASIGLVSIWNYFAICNSDLIVHADCTQQAPFRPFAHPLPSISFATVVQRRLAGSDLRLPHAGAGAPHPVLQNPFF